MDSDATPSPAVDPAAFYRGMFQNPELVFFVLRVSPDSQFICEDGNEAAEKWLGKSMAEMKGVPLREAIGSPALDIFEAQLRIALEKRATHTYHRRMDVPGGEMSWVTTLMPVMEGDGPVTHMLGMVRDIEVEKRLSPDAAHHQALVDHLGLTCPNLIYLFDIKQRRSLFVAGQTQNLIGYSSAALTRMGRNLMPNLLHPDDVDRIERHHARFGESWEGATLTVEYRMRHRDGRYRRFASRDTVIERDSEGRPKTLLGVAMAASDGHRIEEEMRSLSGRVLPLGDDERHRLAEAMHEATGQHLCAADMALKRLQLIAEPEVSAAHAAMGEALNDAKDSLREIKREISVLTYLLRPPVLDSLSMSEAIRVFGEGFQRRSGIVAVVRAAPEIDELPVMIFMPLFRVLQEALANVHRHSQAAKVTVDLDVANAEVVLTVTDDGIGFDRRKESQDSSAGCGLAAMRARMAQLGGTLEVRSRGRGTMVTARAPLVNCNA